MNNKIAVVVDSGSNVNLELRQDLDIYKLPLRIIIDQNEYIDEVDISLLEVLNALDSHKVSSSLPLGSDIMQIFNDLKGKGYTHLIIIAISSGLSGTFNAISNIASDVEGLTIKVFDTKNISLGSGLLAVKAAQMVKKGHSFDEITTAIDQSMSKSKVFFTVGTLDYLIRGGRIGLVAGSIANMLNIKPVISCNQDGIYHTIAKVRGYKRVLRRMIDEAAQFASDSSSCVVYLLNANTKEDVDSLMAYAKEKFTKASQIALTPITPALGIHTGPEAFGIAVIKS